MDQTIKYKRILLKFSGEFIGDNKGEGLKIDSIIKITNRIKLLIKLDIQIGIVLGAGNIFRGGLSRQKEKFSRTFTQTEADRAGMLATVINSILLSDILTQTKIKNQVFSNIFIDSFQFFNALKAKEYLENGFVNIYAGGTSNPFVTTDTSAVLKALETDSEILLKATKVAGVYDSDPIKNKNAKFYKKISYLDVLKNKLKVMDSTAMSMAMDNNLPVAVIDFFKKDNLLNFIMGKDVGTIIKKSS